MFLSNPTKINFNVNLINIGSNSKFLVNEFVCFESIFNQNLCVYFINDSFMKKFNIETFDLDSNQIINTINHAHDKNINCIKHYVLNKKDVVITSSIDNSIKIWDVLLLKNLICIENAHNKKNFLGYFINSICIFFPLNFNEKFIISSCVHDEKLKLWNLNGKFIKEFCNKKGINFIETFIDHKENKNFIIASSNEFSYSFEFENGNLYNIYTKNKNNLAEHYYLIVSEMKMNNFDDKKIFVLIENCDNGFINIYDFHSGSFLKEIFCGKKIDLMGMILWNRKYLFCAGESKIILIDLEKGEKNKEFDGHIGDVNTIRKFKHKIYGEILISLDDCGILKKWMVKNDL